MANVSRGNSKIGYCYLMAGDRSSPVLRDSRLETGNRKTLYLFNLLRGEIIEYALEVVASKLRDLKPEESGWIGELDAGYKKARRGFRVRGGRVRAVPEHRVVPLRRVADDDEDDAGDFDADDSGLWLESEEA